MSSSTPSNDREEQSGSSQPKHASSDPSTTETPPSQSNGQARSGPVEPLADLLTRETTIPFVGLTDADEAAYPDDVSPSGRCVAASPRSFTEVVQILPRAAAGELWAPNGFVATDGTVDQEAIRAVDGLDTAELEALAGCSLDDLAATAAADPVIRVRDHKDIAGLTATLTESRAAALIEAAQRHVPVGERLATTAEQRYARRLDAQGRGAARVVDLALADQPVGEPRYRTAGWEPEDRRGMYVSDIGANSATPVPTGLHVLDDPDHPDVPKVASHPDAGDDALPVDDQGAVIPPAVPVEPRLQLPLDELIAKKLAGQTLERIRELAKHRVYIEKRSHRKDGLQYKERRLVVPADAEIPGEGTRQEPPDAPEISDLPG